jgi:hypothetical protein
VTKIAISYRRTDSDATGRLFDRLALKYGRGSVFRDIDSVPFGSDFRKAIDEALKDADVFIAVVGPNWRGVGEVGKARINDESDLVRIEVETALKRDIPVIPVLVGGASMPQPTELPDSLRDFSFRNAAGIDSGRNFDADVKRLIRSMDRVIQSAAARAGTQNASPSAAQRQIIDPPNEPTPAGVESPVHRSHTASGKAKLQRVPYPVVVGLSGGAAALAVVGMWLIYRSEPQPVARYSPPVAASPKLAAESEKPKPAVAPQPQLQPQPQAQPQALGGPPQQTPKPSLESLARDFANEYMRQSGASAPDLLNFTRQVYAASVMYFGERLNNPQIVENQRRFVALWPQRSFRLKSETQLVKCDNAESICQITGQVDFSHSNPQKFKVSSGVADYEIKVTFGRDGPKIFEDNGHVLSRTNP